MFIVITSTPMAFANGHVIHGKRGVVGFNRFNLLMSTACDGQAHARGFNRAAWQVGESVSA